jgi:hypothetical protein
MSVGSHSGNVDFLSQPSIILCSLLADPTSDARMQATAEPLKQVSKEPAPASSRVPPINVVLVVAAVAGPSIW